MPRLETAFFGNHGADLEINYQSLYESAANVLWRARAKFNEELQEKITALAAAQAKASELAQQLEHEQSSTQTLHRTIDVLVRICKGLSAR